MKEVNLCINFTLKVFMKHVESTKWSAKTFAFLRGDVVLWRDTVTVSSFAISRGFFCLYALDFSSILGR